MSTYFPKVTLSVDSAALQLFQAPATALGIEIEATVIEAPSDEVSTQISLVVTVARSPHNQGTTWAATSLRREGDHIATITPALNISPELREKAQLKALEIAQEISLVGVATVGFEVEGEELIQVALFRGVHSLGNWSIDGSVTSQYEQHLRAILDLPLGSPALTSPCVVSTPFYYGEKENMYRPYLHLMARTPALKFHQYKNDYEMGAIAGHITICGASSLNLLEEINHASDYFSGVIDE